MQIAFPEVLLLPVMMILDYVLTLTGAKLAERKYRLHFKIVQYELNPIWQKSVNHKDTGCKDEKLCAFSQMFSFANDHSSRKTNRPARNCLTQLLSHITLNKVSCPLADGVRVLNLASRSGPARFRVLSWKRSLSQPA